MKLIYIDPFCSGLQVVDCESEEDIEAVLTERGMTEDQCGGEIVYYVFVDKNGKATHDDLNFT